MSEKKNALTVLAAAGSKFALGANLTKAGAVINEQLRLIRNADAEFATRAIYVGTTLLIIKESLEHGEFGPFLSKNIDDLGRRQVSYYMKLALAAMDAARVDQEALLAIPVGDIESALSVSKGPAAEYRAAVKKFVGDSSLAELLAEYCGKSSAAKKSNGGSSDDADETPAVDAGASLYNEAAEHLQALRATLTDDAALMRLKPKQLDELKDSITQLQQEFASKHRLARGKKH